MISFRVLSYLALGFLVFPFPCLAQNEYEVTNPFVDPIARQHFKICFPETTDTDLSSMSRIRSYGYTFQAIEGCPPTEPNCNPALKFFRGRRTTQLNTTELNPGRVAGLAAAQSSGGCSPTSVGNFSSSISRRAVRYSVHVEHEEKICTFLGDITLASGSADILFGYDLQPDFSITSVREVLNESHSVNIFGFILGTLGAATIGGAGLAVTALTVTVAKHDLFKAPADSSSFLGAGIRAAGQFNSKPIDQIGGGDLFKMNYIIQNQEGGFRNDSGEVSLEVFQDGYLNKLLQPGYQQFRRFEIEFIKSLPEVDPELHVVRKGDNLWKLTESKYGDGRLFHLVARYSGMRKPRKLVLGEVIKLPRWHELCEKLKPKNLFVKDRESLWSKAVVGEIPFDFRQVRHLTKNPNLIYPFEELEVVAPKAGP